MKKIIVLLVMCLGLVFVYNHRSVTKIQNQYTTNCYDYILMYMAQPQYWGKKDIVEYSTDQQQTQAQAELLNGTGFKYVEDDAHVIFKRGYQGELFLDFTNHSAQTYLKEEFQLWDSDKAYFYDFNSRRVYLIDLNNPNENIDMTDKMTKINNGFHFSIYSEIEKTVQEYGNYFAEIGCPILGIDKDTFRTYNDIPISINKHNTDFNQFPWQWTGWNDNLINNESIHKLDNINDIWNVNLTNYDNSTLKFLDKDNIEREVYYYNPIFLIFKSKSKIDQYERKDPYESTYFENITMYEDLISDFIIKYANTVCKRIYDGNGCVYWIDTDRHFYLKNGKTEPYFGMLKAEFNSLKINQDTVITFYYHPEQITVGNILYNDAYNDSIYHTYEYLNDVLSHYGINEIADEQYVKNFILYYNLDWQRMLGLR